MPCWNNQPWRRDSNQTASEEPGAAQNLLNPGVILSEEQLKQNLSKPGFS